MRTHRSIILVAAVVTLACSDKKDEAKREEVASTMPAVVYGEFIQPEDSLPRMRYFETGLVGVSDRCAVRKVRLNPKMPPVYVNGHPVGFC